MNKIRNLWQFATHPPTARTLAIRELEKAKREFLEYKTHAEYYTTLCSFEAQRIARLEKYLDPVDHS